MLHRFLATLILQASCLRAASLRERERDNGGDFSRSVRSTNVIQREKTSPPQLNNGLNVSLDDDDYVFLNETPGGVVNLFIYSSPARSNFSIRAQSEKTGAGTHSPGEENSSGRPFLEKILPTPDLSLKSERFHSEVIYAILIFLNSVIASLILLFLGAFVYNRYRRPYGKESDALDELYGSDLSDLDNEDLHQRDLGRAPGDERPFGQASQDPQRHLDPSSSTGKDMSDVPLKTQITDDPGVHGDQKAQDVSLTNPQHFERSIFKKSSQNSHSTKSLQRKNQGMAACVDEAPAADVK